MQPTVSYGTLRQRNERKQVEAKERNATYQALSLDQKLAQQEPFNGKQYKKLLAKKEQS